MTHPIVDLDSVQPNGAEPLVEEDVELSSRDVDRALRVMKRVLALRTLKRRLLKDRGLSGSETLAILDAVEKLERQSKVR